MRSLNRGRVHLRALDLIVISLICRHLVLQHPIQDLDVLAQAGGTFGRIRIRDSRHRVVHLCASGADAQFQPATGYVIHGESLLR
jgi:hypothetical protein